MPVGGRRLKETSTSKGKRTPAVRQRTVRPSNASHKEIDSPVLPSDAALVTVKQRKENDAYNGTQLKQEKEPKKQPRIPDHSTVERLRIPAEARLSATKLIEQKVKEIKVKGENENSKTQVHGSDRSGVPALVTNCARGEQRDNEETKEDQRTRQRNSLVSKAVTKHIKTKVDNPNENNEDEILRAPAPRGRRQRVPTHPVQPTKSRYIRKTVVVTSAKATDDSGIPPLPGGAPAPRGRRQRVPTHPVQPTKSRYIRKTVVVTSAKATDDSGIPPLRGRRRRVPVVTTKIVPTRPTERQKLDERPNAHSLETENEISYSLPLQSENKGNELINHNKTGCEIPGLPAAVRGEIAPTTKVISPHSTRNQQVIGKTADDVIIIEKAFDMLYSEVCKLSKSDIQEKARFIKDVVENEIIAKVWQFDERFTFEILHTGSYYEHLKVTRADEFDIMVKMNAEKISHVFLSHVCPARRDSRDLIGFAYLEYQSHYDKDGIWTDMLVKGPDIRRVLSPQRLLHYFKNLLTKRMKQITSKFPEIKCFEPSLHGPAVTLSFHFLNGKKLDVDVVVCIEIPDWPSVANNWGVFSTKWPSSKAVDDIKTKGCHVVPKLNPKDPRCWRLSFSLAEKSLLSPKAIDEDKKYYRIMKYIYEFHKRFLEPLCSYHLKTLLLHLRSSGHLQGSGRRQPNGIDVIVFLIQEIISRVGKKELKHFFIGHNLNLFRDLTDRDVLRINSCLGRILSKFRDTSSLLTLIEDLKR